jgi:pimeloyl-ACP methyl ester carboxylesterase
MNAQESAHAEPAKIANAARRKLMLGASAAATAALAGVNTAAQQPGAVFVLLHGAWHGGWCWKKVVPLLRAAGHQVYTPTFTGLGERGHLVQPATNLSTHVQDVLAMLEMEDLQRVILVGHSYAGFVLSAVAQLASRRLRKLIYLDAFVPENGKRVTDYLLPLDRREAIIKAGKETGYVAPISLVALGVKDPSDLAWATPRIMRQPFASFDEPVQLTAAAPLSGLPRAYIACTAPASGSFGQFASVIKTDPSWQYRELATGHDAMITAPQVLTDTLLELAAR